MQRKVTISGAGYTNILATIPAHYMRIYEDGDRTSAFEYQLPDDNFASTYVSKVGDVPVVEQFGHGRRGILKRPPNYNASGVPATGEIYCKIRVLGGGTADLIVFETEREV